MGVKNDFLKAADLGESKFAIAYALLEVAEAIQRLGNADVDLGNADVDRKLALERLAAARAAVLKEIEAYDRQIHELEQAMGRAKED